MPPKANGPNRTRPRARRLVTQAERDRVAELHAQGLSRAAIARELDRPAVTIGRIADDLGLTWDRTKTAAAAKALREDNRARRAELSRLLLDDAHRLRERLWSESEQVLSTPKGPARVVQALPPARDARDLMTAVTSAVKSHTDLERVDAGTGAETAKSMLGQLGEALQVAADQINGTASTE